MSPRSPQPILAILAAGFLGATSLHAQQLQDASPPDVKQLLIDLKKMSVAQTAQVQAARISAMQTVSAASAAADGGVSLWETAVRTITIDGAGQDNTNFRIWKETDGEVFKDKAVQNAVHLHLEWLALTLQRSAGATVKEMLPTVINYAHELWADEAYMSMLDASIKKSKDTQPPPVPGRKGGGGGNNNSPAAKTIKDDTAVRKVHDQILNHSVNNSIIVQMMRIADYLTAENWENTPGNVDGIYKNIIQPELRVEKDQRVFEYWDTKLKLEADKATRTKLTFEVDKFNNETRPVLMWGRAEEFANLGLKNRAATDMFTLIKSFPNHPASGEWIAYLQGLLAPTPPSTATTAVPPAAPAPAPAAVVAPVAPPAAANPPSNPTASLPGASLPGALPGSSPLPGALPGQ